MNLAYLILHLEELADLPTQERTWLQDPGDGTLHSYDETICGVFDDSGFASQLRLKPEEMDREVPATFWKKMLKLNELVGVFESTFNFSMDAAALYSPAMYDVRAAAADLIVEARNLEASGLGEKLRHKYGWSQ